MIGPLLGTIAAIFIAAGFIPQIVKALKTKKMDDVSLWMFLIFLAGNSTWLLYGIYIRDMVIIAANAFIDSLCLISIFLKIKYSKTL